MRATRLLGQLGEDLAVQYLVELGWTILERNWRIHGVGERGEVDIVAFDPDSSAVVIVEVKTRHSLRAGHPIEAITPQKLGRLRRLAGLWCSENRPGVAGLRIDVIAVTTTGEGAAEIDHRRAVE